MPILYNPGNAGGGTPVTAGNGLTLNGSEIDLGGTLSEQTIIALNGNQMFVTDSGGGDVMELSDNGVGFSPQQGSQISGNTTGASISFQAGNGPDVQSSAIVLGVGSAHLFVEDVPTGNAKGLFMSNEEAFFTDNIQSQGIGYSGDYSANGIAVYGDRWIPDTGAVKVLLGSTANGSVTGSSASETLFTYNVPGTNGFYELGGAINQISGVGMVVFNVTYTNWEGTTNTISFVDTKTIFVEAGSVLTVATVVTGVVDYDAAAYIKLLF
jgi:hypothetical protein